jgi:hypothetical protein
VSHWHLAGCFSFGLLASGLLVILWLMRGSLPVGRMGEGEGAQIHSHRIVALAKRARRLNCWARVTAGHWAVLVDLFIYLFIYLVVLGLELRAFTLSHSTSPIFVKGFSR